MKIYQNPQPHAVERVSKIKNQKKPSNLAGAKHDKKVDEHDIEKTDKEIFETKSEEQAWRETLEKDKPH
ncbi:hypothetical protein LEAN103870_06030 [Legionella anisa]|uniref:Uncharacterized protein n=1 Tax=Legionella anisa TaxID=28082 RepID=A0AAX0WQ50_9GAMM|nr:hypothetical protein [Legionella anisa]AWN75616.1 hypothetical protein DLD14_18210 [Legionella anisa]KTC76409.1 hypothetical protein Lani_0482 [Legionella anisa]MBN5934816.1 hypothetical protein [Legionella anisa]MCW8424188.1 hypothetical protein [Legionella anisa]MCW8446694.1 hypothetical protein [Legionella anisa]